MEKIATRINTKRKISPITLKNYMSNLKLMVKAMCNGHYTNLNFLKNYDKVKTYLDNQTPSVKRMRLATILVLLQLDSPFEDPLVVKYRDWLFKLQAQYQKTVNTKNTKEEENWLSIEELTNVWNTVKKCVFAEGIQKAGIYVLDKRLKELLQEYVILSVYILQAPRRVKDYSEMRAISIQTYTEMKMAKSHALEHENYVVFYDTKSERKIAKSKGHSEVFFRFGDYKTRKSNGVQILDRLPRNVVLALQLWRRYNRADNTWLLRNAKGGKISSNVLTQNLNRIFKKYTGKDNVSASMLRKIFITHDPDLEAYRASKARAQSTASEMGHSLAQQQMYAKEPHAKRIAKQMGHSLRTQQMYAKNTIDIE
jgi:hypothetical protein